MVIELTNYIKNFQILTDEEIQTIVNSTTVKKYPKGTLLLKEGQVASNCYMILQGCIREYYIKDGMEKSTAFYLEGDSVSSFSSAVENKPSQHFLECAEDCVLTVGNQDLEKEMCEKIPRLKTIILQETEKFSGQKQDELASFIISSPEERYLNLLNKKPELFNRIPQHQIASYLGVTPESLSRIRKRVHQKKSD